MGMAEEACHLAGKCGSSISCKPRAISSNFSLSPHEDGYLLGEGGLPSVYSVKVIPTSPHKNNLLSVHSHFHWIASGEHNDTQLYEHFGVPDDRVSYIISVD